MSRKGNFWLGAEKQQSSKYVSLSVLYGHGFVCIIISLEMGWFKDTELVLEKFLQDEDILVNLVPDVEIEQ